MSEDDRKRDLHNARHNPRLTFEQRYEIWHRYNLPWWKKAWLAWRTGQMRY